jgi:hypothetical protein
MYKCFENVPVEVRQEAFDFLVKMSLAERGRRLRIIPESQMPSAYRGPSACPGKPAEIEGEKIYAQYCPLGAINYVLGMSYRDVSNLGVMQKELQSQMYAGSPTPAVLFCYLVMPPTGRVEQDLLASRGIVADGRSLSRFMGTNDVGGFCYYDMLADAMGVEDTSKQIYESGSFREPEKNLPERTE